MSSPLRQSNTADKLVALIPQMAFCLTVILCACLAFGALPCVGQIVSSESDGAGNECESSEHLALVPSRQEGRESMRGAVARRTVRRDRSDSITARRSLPLHCGHRLSNGLRAPLRC